MAKSFDCYEALFPDPLQRDDPDDIAQWLAASRRGEHTGAPWKDFWGVLHIGDHVIGVSFLSVHRDYPWVFGNYFGVRQGWRDERRSDKFLNDVVDHLRADIPALKGLVFEIERIEFEYLQKMSSDLDHMIFDKRARSNLRAIMRLKYFQSWQHCYSVLTQTGLPLPFWQPSLNANFGESIEEELILMVRPIANDLAVHDINLQEVLDFVYDKLYMDAYGSETGLVHFPGYRSYVAKIKRRVEENMRDGWSIGPLRIRPEIWNKLSTLRRLAAEQDLDGELDL